MLERAAKYAPFAGGLALGIGAMYLGTRRRVLADTGDHLMSRILREERRASLSHAA